MVFLHKTFLKNQILEVDDNMSKYKLIGHIIHHMPDNKS